MIDVAGPHTTERVPLCGKYATHCVIHIERCHADCSHITSEPKSQALMYLLVSDKRSEVTHVCITHEQTVSNAVATKARARNERAFPTADRQYTDAISRLYPCTAWPLGLQVVIHVPASEGDQASIEVDSTVRSGRDRFC